ncbi:MAG: thymidylate kinase [Bacilli bacterium]|nr:thymidylate kinase [Bacilli bacterium]
MSKGKLIVIEGTDCSGKQTQSDKLVTNLEAMGYKAISFSFPNYESPTGKIIGDAYLGKNGNSLFTEGIENVDPKISSLYYAADRAYNKDTINKYLALGYIVILNRYVESNMAFQGGKIKDIKERNMMYEWLDNLEFVLLDLPRPDLVIFLYLPYEYVCLLKEKSGTTANTNILRMAEIAYIELANIYDYQKINCLKDNNLRTIEDISNEILLKVLAFLEMEVKS